PIKRAGCQAGQAREPRVRMAGRRGRFSWLPGNPLPCPVVPGNGRGKGTRASLPNFPFVSKDTQAPSGIGLSGGDAVKRDIKFWLSVGMGVAGLAAITGLVV